MVHMIQLLDFFLCDLYAGLGPPMVPILQRMLEMEQQVVFPFNLLGQCDVPDTTPGDNSYFIIMNGLILSFRYL